MVTPVGSGLFLREDDAKFLEFSKIAQDCPSRAGRPSETSPEVPMEFRVLGGNPESRQNVVLALGIDKDWVGT